MPLWLLVATDAPAPRLAWWSHPSTQHGSTVCVSTGIPFFWKDALTAHPKLANYFTEGDQEVLEYLVDVSVWQEPSSAADTGKG
jgi:hypothetical protein